MPVTFQNADIKFTLKHKKRLKDFIAQQLKVEGITKFRLSYVFCSDDYLLDINRRFLGHDYYTDIITFPLSENGMMEAELYISIDRVKENAVAQVDGKRFVFVAQTIENELFRVIFHGILHLLGFKDKTKTQRTEMRILEDAWLKKYAIHI